MLTYRMFIATVIILTVAYFIYKPKLDYNTETGEYLLWYNSSTALGNYGRACIVIWKKIN